MLQGSPSPPSGTISISWGRNVLTGSGSRLNGRLPFLTVAALGVVYGDIGTSPLYAFRECFSHLAPTESNILGILSMICWSLFVVISVKYMAFVLRADNDGEGGILALMALVTRGSLKRPVLVLLGLFGAALLYGDGVITPAISVLSAVEGLHVATPALESYVLPVSAAVLVVLFLFQSRGTAKIGTVFGPLMIIWFLSLAALGIRQIISNAGVLRSVSPFYAVHLFAQSPVIAFGVLGVVFLVVTGGEALYADMGHFGPKPIRLAWFCVVLPSLLLNYLGQGALLLRDPSAAYNPFYLLAPKSLLYPLVIVATLATVIASQAVISGAFSLTRQAIGLGFCPRLKIFHTSEHEKGQIYMPGVNWLLMVTVLVVVLTFRSSSNLAAAYGVAVSCTMLITTLLALVVSRQLWRWPLLPSLAGGFLFLAIDLMFLGSNLTKIAEGGWLPLLIASVVCMGMLTWKKGRQLLAERLKKNSIPIEHMMPVLLEASERRVPGTAIFLISNPKATPPALIHGTRHYSVLHERIVLMTLQTEDVPRVKPGSRVEITNLGHGFHRVLAHYGFKESPRVPELLELCAARGLEFDLGETTFFVGREALITTNGNSMATWRKKLFDWLSRNARRATDSFALPADRVVELGVQIEI